MIQHVCVTTFTGSVYEIKRTEDGWWLRSENVPNSFSQPLDPETWWEIEMPAPWPPRHNDNLFIAALRSFEKEDHRRMPGGGKMTSPVVSVDIILATE